MNNDNNLTQTIGVVGKQDKTEPAEIIPIIHEALIEKGYNPINQIVGYILSGDPTYITSHNNARSLICRIDRDELVEELVNSYIKNL